MIGFGAVETASWISFTPVPGQQAPVDEGHCECGSVSCGKCQYMTKQGAIGPQFDCCRVGTCSDSYFNYDPTGKSTVLKTTLGGATQSPWVRLRFEIYNSDGTHNEAASAATEITTGNISQPGSEEVCRAAIKAFQYSWGTMGQGSKCRITIVDEEGTSFRHWVERLYKNPSIATDPKKPQVNVYRMRVQWGWSILGGEEEGGCPSGHGGGLQPTCNNAGESTNPRKLLCSPIIWFLPDDLTVNMQQNGKFVYELTGVDVLYRATENASARIKGTNLHKMHFTEAVTTFAKDCLPSFNVSFLQLDSTQKNLTDPLEFYPEIRVLIANPAGISPSPGWQTDPDKPEYQDVKTKGPLMVWRGNEYDPLAAIISWLKFVKANTKDPDQTGKGLTYFYDSTYEPNDLKTANAFRGRMIICRDELPTNCDIEGDVEKRCRAVYIVNGGKCVYGYTTILCDSGWERINKIVKERKKCKVACVDSNGNLQWSDIIGWYRNYREDRKLVKIHLNHSRQHFTNISGGVFTEDHEILTDHGYIAVKDLDILQHKIHSGSWQPKSEVRQAIIGIMLGDGHIKKSNNSFECTHSLKQEQYTIHKANILKLPIKYRSTGLVKKIKIRSKDSPYWRLMHNIFYADDRKKISNLCLSDFSIISLAYLFMDDGHLSRKRTAEIATCNFTTEEVDMLILRLKKLGLNGYRRKNAKYPRIYFSVEETEKLSKAIAPYIIPSMNYKILEKDRIISKHELDVGEEPFFDTFSIARCEDAEQKANVVYCIDVDNYHNFITHSGVVHNCSPVLGFTPQMRWRFMGLRSGGFSGNNVSGTQTKAQTGLCGAMAARNGRITGAIPNDCADLGEAKAIEYIDSNKKGRIANVLHQSIEAELRVQGDPSHWLCTPHGSYGRTVALVVMNPFSVDREEDDPCPSWSLLRTGACNEILTNRAWFIFGADHQIREGSYVTTLKISLFTAGTYTSSTEKVPTGGTAMLPELNTTTMVALPLGIIDPLGMKFCYTGESGVRSTGTIESKIEDAPPRPRDLGRGVGSWDEPACAPAP